MNDLKPCPFCGAEPKMEHLVYPNIEIWFAKCENCCAEINNPSGTEKEAQDAWNRRTGDEFHRVCRRRYPIFTDYEGLYIL